jgi:hypothetical protein
MRRKVHRMTRNVPYYFDFAHLRQDSRVPSHARTLTNLA